MSGSEETRAVTDSFLSEIVDAAEAGKSVPQLKLVTAAGDWIKGMPCSSKRFPDLSYQAMDPRKLSSARRCKA